MSIIVAESRPRPLLIVVDENATEEEWLAARAEGVTASEVHAITQGGRGTWKRILEDKLNGSTFKGNRHTKRGHEREPFLIQYAEDHFGAVRANRSLLAHPDWRDHMATPDGLGWDSGFRGGFGVEVKSHDHGWTRTDVPTEHADQAQFGMHVTGFDWWLYGWEVMGEDGQPTLEEPTFVWIKRDPDRIAKLVTEAERFNAWRADGAPDVDDIPTDLDDAIAEWVAADAVYKAAAKERADAELRIRAAAVDLPRASTEGAKRAGTRGHFTYAVKHGTALDEDAWKAAEPDTYAEWVDAQQRIDAQAAAAAELYQRTTISTRLNIYANKETRA